MSRKRPGAAELSAVLSHAYYGATIRDVDFSEATLTSISGPKLLWLNRCTFVGADLRLATLDKWHFTRCDFRGANLRGASLRGAWFTGCDLTGADLRDTDLRYVNFSSAGVGESEIETCLDDVLWDRGARPV